MNEKITKQEFENLLIQKALKEVKKSKENRLESNERIGQKKKRRLER
jgi:hypothetical protein